MIRAGRLDRSYLRAPEEHHSSASQTSTPGRWRLLPKTSLSATRTRRAEKRPDSLLLVPWRHVTRRQGRSADTAPTVRGAGIKHLAVEMTNRPNPPDRDEDRKSGPRSQDEGAGCAMNTEEMPDLTEAKRRTRAEIEGFR